MAAEAMGTIAATKKMLETIQELEQGQAGFLNTNLLGKEAITIINNSGKKVNIIIDKDIFTDSGGCELADGKADGFGRSGPTNVVADGTNLGNLCPGHKYSIQPGPVVKKIV